jgi:hypothetical protein
LIKFHCGFGAIVKMRLADIHNALCGRHRLRLVRRGESGPQRPKSDDGSQQAQPGNHSDG